MPTFSTVLGFSSRHLFLTVASAVKAKETFLSSSSSSASAGFFYDGLSTLVSCSKSQYCLGVATITESPFTISQGKSWAVVRTRM